MSQDPKKLAYQLHEALLAADPEHLNFQTYADLRAKWVIRYKKDRVIAELIAASAVSGVLAFEGMFDPLDIVQTIIRHKTVNFELYFPDASNQPEDAKLVTAWCTDNQYADVWADTGLRVNKINGNIQATTS